jgi:peptide/nickel transport system ATP-binding protein
VLYLGRLMELGEAETVFDSPHHPYTEALLSAVPTAEGEQRPRIRLQGEIPSHADPPSGCVFHTRCPRYIGDICHQEEPPLKEVEPGHFWRCHYPIEELRELQKSPPGERVAAAPGDSPPAEDAS